MIPAGLVEAKMQAEKSIGQKFATTRSPYAGWTSSETFERIRGMCYHLPFSDYDLNQAQFDRLSDGEQRRFERLTVVPNGLWTGYVDSETGLVIDGVRFHLPFTRYDIGQRTFDRLPREEQLRFEKRVQGGSWGHVLLTKVQPILIDQNGYAY